MSSSPSSPRTSDSGLTISVIVTTYDLDRYDDFRECVDSVLAQSYAHYEVVIVTETSDVREAVSRDYASENLVTIHHLEKGRNLATARNAGAEASSGEVIAFIDDDAVASPDWLAELARGYQESDLSAVGGSASPEWTEGYCWYLPEEYYWLVGATHKGFAEEEGEVRNTFGCNISFERDAFLNLGGFNSNLGKDHGHNLQSEETELCARLRESTGTGLYYVPSAHVEHKVYPEQMTLRWLFDRAYWQGYSKAVVDESAEGATDEEWGFLGYLLMTAIPWYAFKSVTTPRLVAQFILLLSLTGAVGLGFVRAKVSRL